eukprot:1126758-Amorphochlora_amoeboformis.AAC.1
MCIRDRPYKIDSYLQSNFQEKERAEAAAAAATEAEGEGEGCPPKKYSSPNVDIFRVNGDPPAGEESSVKVPVQAVSKKYDAKKSFFDDLSSSQRCGANPDLCLAKATETPTIFPKCPQAS